MRRVIAIAITGLGLAGCSTFSMDSFKSAPTPIQVQLESVPSGAEARTSLGQSCKTPCTVAVPADGGFSVSYTLNRFQPATVQVQVIRNSGDFATPASVTVDPNPVVADLQPAGPPPRSARKPMRPKKPRPPKAAAAPAGAAPASGSSPFPPAAAPPPPPTR